jgi:hypothetical protein
MHVDKTIDKMFYAELARRKKYYPMLFTAQDAPAGADYTEATLSELGLARTIIEGGRVETDLPVEGNKVTRTYKKIGLSVQLTEELLDDDLTGKWKQIPSRLVDSIEEKIEYDCAAVLSNGFAAAGDSDGTSKGQDGQVLFYASHALLKGGGTVNNLGSADLSSTSLQAAFDYGQTMKGENGFIRPIRPKTLVIHPAAMWVANDLLKATGRVWDYYGTDAGSNMKLNSGLVGATTQAPGTLARNLLNPGNGVVDSWNIIVNPYLKGTDDWFVLFEDYDLNLFWKWRARLDNDGDFGTGNKVYKATARYSVFSNKYQYMYGCVGA